MSNEAMQTVSQISVALGLFMAALGGYGAYHFSRCIEKGKELRTSYSGELNAGDEVLLSGKDDVWPQVELGDSGTIFVWQGPNGQPMFTFGEDTQLTISRENGKVKVSTTIRDKSGRLVAELVKNEWKVNPQNSWDRNYTADALEVRDPTGDVVLQVRALPDRVQLQVKSYNSEGYGWAFGKDLGPNGWSGVIERSEPPNELRQRIEPIFKYPSDSHLGN